jgi:hypothetical protein
MVKCEVAKKDFETLQLGAFVTPDLRLAQGPVGLTAESRLNFKVTQIKCMERFVFMRNCVRARKPQNLREKADPNRSSVSVELGFEMWLKGTMASQNVAVSHLL